MKFSILALITASLAAEENIGLSDDWLNDMNDQIAKVLFC